MRSHVMDSNTANCNSVKSEGSFILWPCSSEPALCVPTSWSVSLSGNLKDQAEIQEGVAKSMTLLNTAWEFFLSFTVVVPHLEQIQMSYSPSPWVYWFTVSHAYSLHWILFHLQFWAPPLEEIMHGLDYSIFHWISERINYAVYLYRLSLSLFYLYFTYVY